MLNEALAALTAFVEACDAAVTGITDGSPAARSGAAAGALFRWYGDAPRLLAAALLVACGPAAASARAAPPAPAFRALAVNALASAALLAAQVARTPVSCAHVIDAAARADLPALIVRASAVAVCDGDAAAAAAAVGALAAWVHPGGRRSREAFGFPATAVVPAAAPSPRAAAESTETSASLGTLAALTASVRRSVAHELRTRPAVVDAISRVLASKAPLAALQVLYRACQVGAGGRARAACGLGSTSCDPPRSHRATLLPCSRTPRAAAPC